MYDNEFVLENMKTIAEHGKKKCFFLGILQIQAACKVEVVFS